MLKFTTSWDDGDVLDIKLAALLERYGFTGTFYVTKKYRSERLSENQIKILSEKHEIGAHTLTHPDPRTLSRVAHFEEIVGSKKWLEEILGKSVSMFCYPAGRFDEVSEELVREAGFTGARTTEAGQIDAGENPFRMPTTIQIYPFPFRKISATRYSLRYFFEPFFSRGPVFRKLGISLYSMRNWQMTARAAFDVARAQGTVFHVWGHSWEIEKYGMWNEFEKFLAYCKEKGGYEVVVNSELL